MLLQTPSGQTWLQAQHNLLAAREQRGSFRFHSTVHQHCQTLRVDRSWSEGGGWYLQGGWREQGCNQHWLLQISAAEAQQLALTFKLSPGPLQHLRLQWQTETTEHWFGGGEQFSYPRLNGQVLPVWIQENGIGRGAQPVSSLIQLFSPGSEGHALSSYIVVPWIFSQRNRGFALENSEYSEWDLRSHKTLELRVWSPEIRLRLLGAGHPLELLSRYTQWAGRMPELPDWADTGLWAGIQGGTARVRAILAQLRQRKTPLAAVWIQDWVGKRKTSIGSQLWWNWELNSQHYAGWPQFLAETRSQGIRVLGYLNPFLVDVSGLPGIRRNIYAEARARGYLIKDAQGEVLRVQNTDFSAGMLDLSHPEARRWFRQLVREQLLQIGLSGWMADYGEALPLEAHLYSGEAAARAHNRYAEEWARLQREIQTENPHQQIVIFLRSGFTHSPGCASLFWQGDQTVSWDGQDGLRSALQGLISGGLSGFSLNHSDAGGYTSICQMGIGLCRSPELLMRWLEANAWSPVLRTHEGNQPEVQAQFYSSPTLLDAVSHSARMYKAWRFLRRQLFAEAASQGWPVVRHMLLHSPEAPEAPWLQDQYYLGPDVVVAPVLEPGQTRRKLWLPAGPWIHLWTGTRHGFHTRSTWTEVAAPLGYPPVFWRQGSVTGQQLHAALAETRAGFSKPTP